MSFKDSESLDEKCCAQNSSAASNIYRRKPKITSVRFIVIDGYDQMLGNSVRPLEDSRKADSNISS